MKRAGWMAFLACAGFSPTLGAQALPPPRPQQSDDSPQYVALELRFGPYLPRVDQNTTQPVFEGFFGDDARLYVGAELDLQLWRIPYVGPIGVGLGWGYTSMSGTNRLPAGGTAGGPVSQESTLSIMPTYAVGVLRIDALAKQLKVPVVPYGKLGIAHAFWWVDDGVGTARNDENVAGKDTSTGLQAALGGMFLLDVLEPSAARALDTVSGINNSYVFLEWSLSDYEGDQMNVGASTWVTGIALEM